MICPSCGTHIPDGSTRCPACHAGIGATAAMPAVYGRWCPSCGSGVGWEDEVCPACGYPLEELWGAPVEGAPEAVAADVDAPPPSLASLTEDADETSVIPRIESAIPPEDDPESKVVIQEDMPRVRRLILASLASVVLISGITLMITHPWDPDIYSIKATEEADTSMAGFPGTVETLSGQDSDGTEDYEVLTGDDATYAELTKAYDQLARYEERANQSEELFAEVAYEGDKEARASGSREAQALAIDISNLIDNVSQIDVSSGVYAQDRDHINTLASWLRNRVDTLREAWRAAAESSDPAAEKDYLHQLVTANHGADGVNAYQVLFDDNYADWKPEKKSS